MDGCQNKSVYQLMTFLSNKIAQEAGASDKHTAELSKKLRIIGFEVLLKKRQCSNQAEDQMLEWNSHDVCWTVFFEACWRRRGTILSSAQNQRNVLSIFQKLEKHPGAKDVLILLLHLAPKNVDTSVTFIKEVPFPRWEDVDKAYRTLKEAHRRSWSGDLSKASHISHWWPKLSSFPWWSAKKMSTNQFRLGMKKSISWSGHYHDRIIQAPSTTTLDEGFVTPEISCAEEKTNELQMPLWDYNLVKESPKERNSTWEELGAWKARQESISISEINVKCPHVSDRLHCPPTPYRTLVEDIKSLLVGVSSNSFKLESSQKKGTTWQLASHIWYDDFSHSQLKIATRPFCKLADHFGYLKSFCCQTTKDVVLLGICSGIRAFLRKYEREVLSIPVDGTTLISLGRGTSMRELMQQINLMRSLVVGLRERERPLTGSILLDRLYFSLTQGLQSSFWFDLVSGLFLKALNPYFKLLGDWIFLGKAHSGFFITPDDRKLSLQTRESWLEGHTADHSKLPKFLRPLAPSIYLCGKTVQLLLKCEANDVLVWIDLVPRLQVIFDKDELCTLEKECKEKVASIVTHPIVLETPPIQDLAHQVALERSAASHAFHQKTCKRRQAEAERKAIELQERKLEIQQVRERKKVEEEERKAGIDLAEDPQQAKWTEEAKAQIEQKYDKLDIEATKRIARADWRLRRLALSEKRNSMLEELTDSEKEFRLEEEIIKEKAKLEERETVQVLKEVQETEDGNFEDENVKNGRSTVVPKMEEKDNEIPVIGGRESALQGEMLHEAVLKTAEEALQNKRRVLGQEVKVPQDETIPQQKFLKGLTKEAFKNRMKILGEGNIDCLNPPSKAEKSEKEAPKIDDSKLSVVANISSGNLEESTDILEERALVGNESQEQKPQEEEIETHCKPLEKEPQEMLKEIESGEIELREIEKETQEVETPVVDVENLFKKLGPGLFKTSKSSQRTPLNCDIQNITVGMYDRVQCIVEAQSKLVSFMGVRYLLKEAGLYQALKDLRKYFLLTDLDFWLEISSKLFSLNHSDLTASKDLVSVLRLSPPQLSFVIKSDLPTFLDGTSSSCFNFLTLSYSVNWPLNIILTETAFQKYNDLFKFIFNIRRASYLLNGLVPLLNVRSPHIGMPEFKQVHTARHIMSHMVGALEFQLYNGAIESAWQRLITRLSRIDKIDKIYEAHVGYIKYLLSAFFYSKRCEKLKKGVDHMLDCIFTFCEMVNNGWIWDEDKCDSSMQRIRRILRKFLSFANYVSRCVDILVTVYGQSQLEPLHSLLVMNSFYVPNSD